MFDDATRRRLEHVLAELRWRRYGGDPAAFFREAIWIPSQQDERGRTKFDLFDYQEDDLDTFLNERFVCVLKGRQIGLSTLVGALALWRCLFRPGSVILWISNNQENANKAVQMLETMWHFLPRWVHLRAPQLTANQAGKKEWTFADGMRSRIRAYAGTATAGASETASIVILDEFALVDGHVQDDLYRSADPTVDAGGSLWLVSTARGGHNRFANTFRRASRGESKFVPIFHPWMVSRFVNPLAGRMRGCPACGGRGLRTVRDGEHRRQVLCAECVDTSIYDSKAREFEDEPWLVHAEYPATEEEAFRESGNPVFPDLPLEEDCFDRWTRGFMRRASSGRVEFVEDPSGPLRVRDDVAEDGPDPWRQFVLFVDPAEGVGGDYTAAQVLTWDDDALPEIVAWWHANDVPAVDAARELGNVGLWFAGADEAALLAVETTGGHGASMLTELNVHEDYPNLYVHTPSDTRRRQRAQKLGLPMSWQKRPQVIERLADFLKPDKQVGAIFPLLRSELATFVQNKAGRLEADTGCHDDLVMALAGGLWVLVEETSATSRPTSEEQPVGAGRQVMRLDGLNERVEQARELEADRQARWERRVSRRVEARRRSAERRRAGRRVGSR